MYHDNTRAGYADGKIDAERCAEREGVAAAVDEGNRMAVEATEPGDYIGGWRVRAAQLARAAGLQE